MLTVLAILSDVAAWLALFVAAVAWKRSGQPGLWDLAREHGSRIATLESREQARRQGPGPW